MYHRKLSSNFCPLEILYLCVIFYIYVCNEELSLVLFLLHLRCEVPEAVDRVFLSFAKAFKKPKNSDHRQYQRQHHSQEVRHWIDHFSSGFLKLNLKTRRTISQVDNSRTFKNITYTRSLMENTFAWIILAMMF